MPYTDLALANHRSFYYQFSVIFVYHSKPFITFPYEIMHGQGIYQRTRPSSSFHSGNHPNESCNNSHRLTAGNNFITVIDTIYSSPQSRPTPTIQGCHTKRRCHAAPYSSSFRDGESHTTVSASRHMQERHTPARYDFRRCDWLGFRGIA